MKFTISTYPDIPGAGGSPCWNLKMRWLYFDADWNTRFPFGTSLCIRVGPLPAGRGQPNLNPGFTLDVNAPEGEPNRLYLFLGGGWQVILGLPQFRDFRVTGTETGPSGRPVIHGENFTSWLRPHIAGCSRYRYHQETEGKWIRNDKPERGHWGWLTISRHRA